MPAMKVIKQYPHISFLLIVSTAIFAVGVMFFAFFTFLNQPNEKYIKTQSPPPDENRDYKQENEVIKSYGRANAYYYSAKGKTISMTEFSSLYPLKNSHTAFNNSNGFSMQAYFENYGWGVSKPETISLFIVATSGDNTYSDNLTFKIFLNGNLAFDEKSQVGNVAEDRGETTVSLNQKIPYALFLRMCASKKVEMKIGSKKIKLLERDIQIFRDLVSLIDGQYSSPQRKEKNTKVESVEAVRFS